MPVSPCTHKSDCTPCDPVLDTQEAFDAPSFLGLVRVPKVPRLGENFSAQGCQRWCYSTVSQADADLCALQQAQFCNNTRNFFSAEQTCIRSCLNAPNIVTVIPAGTVISDVSQEDADARAYALACYTNETILCGGPGGGGDAYYNQEQGVSCAGGVGMNSRAPLPSNLRINGPTLTVEAGSFSSISQEAANAVAATYVNDYFNAGIASGDIICGCPSLGTMRPHIVGYTDGFFQLAGSCLTTTPSSAPAWDGWFRSPFSVGSSCVWIDNGANSTPPQPVEHLLSLNGRLLRSAYIIFLLDTGGHCRLFIQLASVAPGTNIISPYAVWNGTKSDNDSPAGIFTQDTVVPGCSPGPLTIEVELAVPPP